MPPQKFIKKAVREAGEATREKIAKESNPEAIEEVATENGPEVNEEADPENSQDASVEAVEDEITAEINRMLSDTNERIRRLEKARLLLIESLNQ